MIVPAALAAIAAGVGVAIGEYVSRRSNRVRSVGLGLLVLVSAWLLGCASRYHVEVPGGELSSALLAWCAGLSSVSSLLVLARICVLVPAGWRRLVQAVVVIGGAVAAACIGYLAVEMAMAAL